MSGDGSQIETGAVTGATKKADIKTSETDRFPTTSKVLDRYHTLWPDSAAQNSIIKKYTMQDLAEGKSGDQLTANPTQPGNTEYERHSPFDRQQFLRERLRGRVIDIGSGGVNELEGIVADEDVVYVDNNPQQQLNFHQVSVGEEPLPFTDQAFGAVYSRNAIQSEDGARAILPEAWRVLGDGGQMVIELQYLPDGERTAVLGALTVLADLGVNVEEQTELIVDEASIQHKQHPELRFNQPSIILAVKKQENHS